ncbi:hypothetical protein QQG55_39500 [Brugia pahangi]
MTTQIFGQFKFVPLHTAYHFIKSVHDEEQLRQKFEKTICFDEVNQNAHWVEPEVNEVGRARTEMTVNMMAAYPEISKITFTGTI